MEFHPDALRTNRKRVWIAALLIAAILATMLAIFLFSAESPSESGDRSRSVTITIARILYPDFDGMSRAEQARIVDDMHLAVRKGAHFTVYTLLGGLAMTALAVLLASRARSAGWMLCLSGLAAVFGLAYAISDEVHQKFVGRGASPWDVCIDFAGVLFGILIARGITHVVRRAKGEGST